MNAGALFAFSSFFRLTSLAHRMIILVIFRVDSPSLVKPFWKCLQECTLWCVSLVILKPIQLTGTANTNHHSWQTGKTQGPTLSHLCFVINCRGFSPVLHGWYYYSYGKLGKWRFQEAKSNTLFRMRPATVYCFSMERKVSSFEDWVVILLDFYPSLPWLGIVLLLFWKGSLLLSQRKSQRTF